jgi:hypothetical protein
MNTDITFKNTKVQKLYNLAHSRPVAQLKHTTDIKNALLPYINDVINDTDAYLEAREKWDMFNYSVVTHVEKQETTYIRMDNETSMCFSLYMYIYH